MPANRLASGSSGLHTSRTPPFGVLTGQKGVHKGKPSKAEVWEKGASHGAGAPGKEWGAFGGVREGERMSGLLGGALSRGRKGILGCWRPRGPIGHPYPNFPFSGDDSGLGLGVLTCQIAHNSLTGRRVMSLGGSQERAPVPAERIFVNSSEWQVPLSLFLQKSWSQKAFDYLNERISHLVWVLLEFR